MSKHDIKFPIRYDKESGFFFDDKNNMIAEIRGWGRIQYLNNPEEVQDANAQFIVTACNHHAQLKAENQRLREALEMILKESEFQCTYDSGKVYEIAEDALRQKGEY